MKGKITPYKSEKVFKPYHSRLPEIMDSNYFTPEEYHPTTVKAPNKFESPFSQWQSLPKVNSKSLQKTLSQLYSKNKFKECSQTNLPENKKPINTNTSLPIPTKPVCVLKYKYSKEKYEF